MGKARLTKDDLRVKIRPFARREPEGTCANALQQVIEDLDAANDEIARLTIEVKAVRSALQVAFKGVKTADDEIAKLTDELKVARKPKAKPVEEGKKNV